VSDEVAPTLRLRAARALPLELLYAYASGRGLSLWHRASAGDTERLIAARCGGSTESERHTRPRADARAEARTDVRGEARAEEDGAVGEGVVEDTGAVGTIGTPSDSTRPETSTDALVASAIALPVARLDALWPSPAFKLLRLITLRLIRLPPSRRIVRTVVPTRSNFWSNPGVDGGATGEAAAAASEEKMERSSTDRSTEVDGAAEHTPLARVPRDGLEMVESSIIS